MESTAGTKGRRGKRFAGVAGLLAAGALAGGVMAGTLTASAATTSTSNTAAAAAPAFRAGGPTPVRAGEKAVSDSVAQKLRAAALKAVPGGSVYRVETDADGATYEAHMTKADGSPVTVKFDASFKVTAVQSGMGAGGPGAGPGTAN